MSEEKYADTQAAHDGRVLPEFKAYRRTNIAEMRDLDPAETKDSLSQAGVSISAPDMQLPDNVFATGKIARNPVNHADQWYVAPAYVANNFELVF